MTAVAVHDAFRIYGEGARAAVALKGLTLDVRRGEIVVVLGPSGSGKTTLLRTVGGLERLSAGSARVLGTELGLLSRRRLAAFRAENLGFLDQHYTRSLSPELGVRHAVGLPLMLRGQSRAEAMRAADGLLERVGLGDRGDDRPRTLSGGEQQRVAVCAAIAHAPKLLLVDEPAGELDAVSAATVYAMLAEVARSAGAAALIVSHDAAATAIADRVVHVRDGRVLEHAPPGEDTVRDQHVDSRPRHRRNRSPSSAPWTRPTARESSSARSTSRPSPGGSRPSSAAPERARPPCFTFSPGLERPTAGECLLDGEVLAGKPREELARLRAEAISVVTQEPGLVPHLSARENVTFGLGLRGMADGADRVDETLAAVGLAELSTRRAATLSAGERQRVAIARALASGAPLMLADEPTARLDEENARVVGRLLMRAVREDGLAVVCATHDPALIELADDVVHLESS